MPLKIGIREEKDPFSLDSESHYANGVIRPE
jgi:hypothetical protein